MKKELILSCFVFSIYYFQLNAQNEDCINAKLLCDKENIEVNKLNGTGTDPNELAGTCIGSTGIAFEQASYWYYWVAANNGKITFTITPKGKDDLDFSFYELPNGISSCEQKIILRCNATHPISTNGSGLVCGYKTGLDLNSIDVEEDYNCDAGEDGFCKYVDMEKGNTYALYINNWSIGDPSYTIEWGGDGEFDKSTCEVAAVGNINNKNINQNDFIIKDNNIYFLDDGLKTNIQLLNQDGKLILNKKLEESNVLSIEHLAPGMYYLIYGNDKSKIHKLMKK